MTKTTVVAVGGGCWGTVAVVGLDLFISPPLCCKRRGGCKNNFFIAASPIVTRSSFPLLTFPSKQASNQYMDQKPNRKTKTWSERKKSHSKGGDNFSPFKKG